MRVVVNMCAAEFLRQIDEAKGQTEIEEIGKRLGQLTELMTPVVVWPYVPPPPSPPPYP